MGFIRQIGLIAFGLALFSVSGHAQWVALGYEQITASATATGFTATTLQPGGGGTSPQATVGMCKLTTAQVRYRIDGPSPTSTTGILVDIGGVITLQTAQVLKNFKAIRTGGTSGVLDCQVGLQ